MSNGDTTMADDETRVLSVDRATMRRQLVNRIYAIRARMAGGTCRIVQPRAYHLRGNGGYAVVNWTPTEAICPTCRLRNHILASR